MATTPTFKRILRWSAIAVALAIAALIADYFTDDQIDDLDEETQWT